MGNECSVCNVKVDLKAFGCKVLCGNPNECEFTIRKGTCGFNGHGNEDNFWGLNPHTRKECKEQHTTLIPQNLKGWKAKKGKFTCKDSTHGLDDTRLRPCVCGKEGNGVWFYLDGSLTCGRDRCSCGYQGSKSRHGTEKNECPNGGQFHWLNLRADLTSKCRLPSDYKGYEYADNDKGRYRYWKTEHPESDETSTQAGDPKVSDPKRRLVELGPQVQASPQPVPVLHSQDGPPVGAYVVLIILVGFLAYWLRSCYRRSRPKTRDSLRDLEAGRGETSLHVD